jgi:hypothetical protein
MDLLYWNQRCDGVQKSYAYQILALLFGMKQMDLNRLNQNVPLEVKLKCQWRIFLPTNIEDVLLSIFDKENFNFYH